jgi:hypothetical protein
MKGLAGSEHAHIAPLPRISLHAFCESPETARIIEAAASDRRVERAHVSVHMGGPPAAVEAYRDTATPNVIVLDTAANRGDLVAHLEALAEFCDAGPRWSLPGERTTSSSTASSWRAASANILSRPSMSSILSAPYRIFMRAREQRQSARSSP